MLNLASYLARIGYTGPTTPTAEVLRAIHRRHLLTVPFENLDIARATKIVCEEDAFLRKIVDRNRGGFCYEMNGAFAALLRGLRFEVSLLSARVPREDGTETPEFDHMTLRVDLDKPWLADVGFRRLLPGTFTIATGPRAITGWTEVPYQRGRGFVSPRKSSTGRKLERRVHFFSRRSTLGRVRTHVPLSSDFAGITVHAQKNLQQSHIRRTDHAGRSEVDHHAAKSSGRENAEIRRRVASRFTEVFPDCSLTKPKGYDRPEFRPDIRDLRPDTRLLQRIHPYP